jgi:DNA processing protein
MKINSISATSPTFPDRLLNIPKPPASLYTVGDIPEYKLGVAIVGTRKPTAYGRQVTSDITSRLAERGAVVISGLAHGIDGIAHETAVKAGGKTIAVLPSGLDQIYPGVHRGLAKKIIETGGALVSEYEPGTPPLQYRFLERNRLVSGLADIVIVTEASIRSGTMNTTMHALEQGRDVYAVPGPITSAMSAGCNALILQGATPIVDIEQFVDSVMPKASKAQLTILAQTLEEQTILDLLSSGISEGDELQTQSKLDPTSYSQTMTMLEIRGAIRSLGANRWGL